MNGDFGAALRHLRTTRGISQATLGGNRYTASYISHLESGRREPTSEVIGYLADVLGVQREELQPVDSDLQVATDIADLELELSQCWRDGDLVAGIEVAEQLGRLAAAHDRPTVWWRASFERTRLLMLQGDLGAGSLLLRGLAEHELTGSSLSLRAEALNLQSTAMLWQGDLLGAAATARRAVAATDAMSPGASRRMRASAALTSALVAQGDLPAADDAMRRLLEERDVCGVVQVVGIAAWTVAEVRLLAGDLPEAEKELRWAADLLSPDSDASLWWRFHRAVAFHLARLGRLGSAGEHLAMLRAAPPARVPDEQLMELVARAVVDADPAEPAATAARLDSEVAAGGAEPSYLRAEADLLRAGLLLDAGDHDGAGIAAARSARTFQAAGAAWRATRAWELFERSVATSEPPDRPGP